MSRFVEVTLLVAGVLDDLGVPYMVCGSFASSVLGEARTTRDIDFVVDLQATHVDALVARLGSSFYADPDAIADAVRRRSSCNVIHFGSGIKVDLFVLPDDDFAREEMRRRVRTRVTRSPARHAMVASAEDVVLSKLMWYEKGDRVSGMQWRDVLGVLKIHGASLDRGYMVRWARELGLGELLERAWSEAGLAP